MAVDGSRPDGGWETVKIRDGRSSPPRWDVFPWGGGSVGNQKGALTSVYFSKFPDSYSAKSFFELFACIGKVAEVAISPRKNRFGIKFGFAGFEGVEDGRLLAVRCDNVMILGVKIHANLPRFECPRFDSGKGGGFQVSHEGGVPQKKTETKGAGVFARSDRRDGRSYAKVVHEGEGSNYQVCAESRPKLRYSSKAEDRNRLEKAYVGVVSIPGSTYNIQSHFEMEGFFQVKVTPMGGNLCLLEESEEGIIKDLIGDGETWWKQWFQVIRRWNELDIDDGRVSWISVYGVPIHAWNAEFFTAVANSLGTFICLDESTAEGSNFDTARMMVRVKLNHELASRMEVRIDEKIFVPTKKEDAVGSMHNVTGSDCNDDILLSNPVSLAGLNSVTVLDPYSVLPKNAAGAISNHRSVSGEIPGVRRKEGVIVLEGGTVSIGCNVGEL
ncbi:uncharacterized protein LOC131636852 [Vicia villosa]|uniref:uncharacterized protein LOC131636852 n=1 Tax=Vicia villosa TaxID=3911 RepID=UPI00273C9869|nr:uncharacterized protein LOC131636852 [Vicia villosa]